MLDIRHGDPRRLEMRKTDALAAVQRADAAFFEALVDADIPALEELLAEEFLIIDVASGSVHPRAAFLGAISGAMVIFQGIETFPDETVIRPRLIGPGTGIVIGRTAMSFSDAEGSAVEVGRWMGRATHKDDGEVG
jgi:ketosteroid isomerase-like protein